MLVNYIIVSISLRLKDSLSRNNTIRDICNKLFILQSKISLLLDFRKTQYEFINNKQSPKYLRKPFS